MSDSVISSEKRRVGRPRKREISSEAEPRELILRAAAGLFAARGIAEVSMLEIAEASGLVQSSLYYWFRRKELIVAELLQQVNRVPLAYAQRLRSAGASADVQLYRLVRFDVRNVCDFPLEITEVHRFGQRNRGAFETYWRERRELTRTVEKLIDDGMSEGSFRAVDSYLCALTIIAQNESVQNWRSWQQSSGRTRTRTAVGSDRASARYTTEEIAEFVASQTVGGLIAAPSKLEAIKRQAKER